MLDQCLIDDPIINCTKYMNKVLFSLIISFNGGGGRRRDEREGENE